MKNNEFGLTLNGSLIKTSFKKIEELIVPYFKNIEKLIFHDDGRNVTIENQDWDIYIYLSNVLIENEEDYLVSIGHKGSFEEGEKALKAFANYLSDHGFVYSMEYEDTEDQEYLIEHPDWADVFRYRREHPHLYTK